MARPVPVIGVTAHGKATDVAMVPYQELDSFLSELSDDFDFGLGEIEVSGFELGKLKASGKLKIKASVKAGKYKPVIPHKVLAKATAKPTAKRAAKRAPAKKPPGKLAVAKQRAKGKKVAIVARQKPHAASERPVSMNEAYSMLKKQGKIINLMKAKRDATSEHKALMARDAFQGNVLSMLKAIDKKICTKPGADGYRGRWNRLKIATGAW